MLIVWNKCIVSTFNLRAMDLLRNTLSPWKEELQVTSFVAVVELLNAKKCGIEKDSVAGILKEVGKTVTLKELSKIYIDKFKCDLKE